MRAPVDEGALSPTSAADTPVERLLLELSAAWRQGRHVSAEEVLARHPEVTDKELQVRLVYEEYLLREEFNEPAPASEFLRRFPHLGDELAVLLDCHEQLQAPGPVAKFPEAGEALGEFALVAELGRGAQGRVFLATQPSLGGRPVVLKLTAGDDHEHLSLARLQHTNIVPLYAREEFPARRLQALCMPYAGQATLAHLGRALCDLPLHRWTGRALLDVIDRAQAAVPVAPLPTGGAARAFLAGASHVRAVCWVGACLAEALQHAHERGLVHLDIKPSNVLLAADGTPMLLDFHLARGPITAGGPAPAWLGGTPGHMAPEQRQACEAVKRGRPVPLTVDGRADVYALGVLLWELLGGQPAPRDGMPAGRLDRLNPRVSVGLADVVHKCLEADPARRYAAAGDLAADLRRHLDDLPLRGVANRSVRERWRKWRRRRPYDLPLVAGFLALLAALAGGTALLGARYAERHRRAEEGLRVAQYQLGQGRYGEAAQTLRQGLDIARTVPGDGGLVKSFTGHLRLARRGQEARQLHLYADMGRFFVGLEAANPRMPYVLRALCRQSWESRGLLTDPEGPALEGDLEQAIRIDLADTAVLWGDLEVRLADAAEVGKAHRQALDLLAEAETACGPSAVLDSARRDHAAALGQAGPARGVEGPLPAWQCCSLARRFLWKGNVRKAAAEAEEALRLEPEGFWPNYYYGVCASRTGHNREAVEALCVCVGQAPGVAECLWKRGQAYEALGDRGKALRDLDRALHLKPDLAQAAFDRGMIHLRAGRYAEAIEDLQLALGGGPRAGAIAGPRQRRWGAPKPAPG